MNKWTEKQLREFDRITWDMSSSDQVTRIKARLDFPKWQKDNGLDDATCDEMFAVLKSEDRKKVGLE